MNYKAVADFLFEVGMLKRTPRTGFQFLGSGSQNVAEHSFRCAVIGYALARMAGSRSPESVALMCLFHDFAEARTGDHNYVNKMYVKADEERAVNDMTADLDFADEIQELIRNFNERDTPEADLAHDADQLELILELKEHADLGNTYAKDWIRAALKRLRTEEGRRLAGGILETHFAGWWFKEKDDEWWVNGGKKDPPRRAGSPDMDRHESNPHDHAERRRRTSS